MSKLYVRSSLSAVGLLLAVALAAACADDPARSTMPAGRSHGLVTLPGDNPDPSDPSDPSGPQYAVKRCNVTDIEVTSLSRDGKTVQPDPIAGTTELYTTKLVGAWSTDGTGCFPETGNVDPNHMVVWAVGQWG